MQRCLGGADGVAVQQTVPSRIRGQMDDKPGRGKCSGKIQGESPDMVQYRYNAHQHVAPPPHGSQFVH